MPLPTVLPDDTATERETREAPDRPLKCACCGNPVTRDKAAIEIEGLHEHVQANPHGVVFAFRCFAEAPGCDVVGDATLAHSWFAGHAWQLALCDQCMTHLGWYFRSSDAGFFGLIGNRLAAG